MVTIAVDAMGGDKAPVPEVEGAIQAARQFGHRVLLVGDKAVVQRELDSHPSARQLPIEVVHAPERITMDDHAAKAARSKRNSSMHVSARLVATNETARAALESQLPDLRNRLSSAGVNVGGLDVSSGQTGSGQPGAKGNDTTAPQPAGSPAAPQRTGETGASTTSMETGRINVIA